MNTRSNRQGVGSPFYLYSKHDYKLFKALTHSLNIKLFIPIAHTHCDTHRLFKTRYKLAKTAAAARRRGPECGHQLQQLLPRIFQFQKPSAPALASASYHVTTCPTSAGLRQHVRQPKLPGQPVECRVTHSLEQVLHAGGRHAELVKLCQPRPSFR